MIGTMCKVDPITKTQARGRYARIYMEIDISKPLFGSFNIDDITVRVEYESLGMICFKCRRYGHSKDSCREGMVEQNVEEPPESSDRNQDEKEKSYYDGRKYYGNGKSTGSTDEINLGKTTKGKKTDDGIHKVNVSTTDGSRFNILSEEGDAMMKDDIGQLNISSEKNMSNGNKLKKPGILSEITNLNEQATQKNKKSIIKKTVKPIVKGGQAKKGAQSQKEDNYKPRNSGRLVGKKQNLNPTFIEKDNILDSTKVLLQLRKDVKDFHAKFTGGHRMDTTDSMVEEINSGNKDSDIRACDNFDVVASDLVEAMAVISE
ncbi:hypothetical protein Dsin_009224 [Dipteronia sinensis]|uniref:CCHC-type domain-containing protein n=1 Tax=Dipteronia sinensis TaxID=43782 RepID=A0AAE0ARF1_9ROSI|nr:hypothetical protein Dsin_009224 [Dipteronia sinensis]